MVLLSMDSSLVSEELWKFYHGIGQVVIRVIPKCQSLVDWFLGSVCELVDQRGFPCGLVTLNGCVYSQEQAKVLGEWTEGF